MSKYNTTIKIVRDSERQSDLNWINYRMQHDFGKKFINEYSQKLHESDPSIHPDDLKKHAEKRKDAYFKQSFADIVKLAKAFHDQEILHILDRFEEDELLKIKTFFETYPKAEKIILNYERTRILREDVHAIYTPDHKQRWDIASDIAVMILSMKPAFVTFSDELAENRFSNNIVNTLTNTFDLRQLTIIKGFYTSDIGKKYIEAVLDLYNNRYTTVEEIYKKNYPVFAQPEQEKKSGKEFE